MTILDKTALIAGEDEDCTGPYIRFCQLDQAFSIKEAGWPKKAQYEEGIFFSWHDDLLSAYCHITQNYAPFDPYEFIQLARPDAIYELSAKLLMWEYLLINIPENRYLHYLEEFDYLIRMTTSEQLKADLLETLHYLIARLHRAAANGKCIAIVGI